MKVTRRVAAAVSLASILCLSSISFAAKPPPPPPPASSDPQLAYRLPDGKGTKLVVSTESGANQMTLYKSSASFRFDLAPRGQREVAIVDGFSSSPTLKLLTYDINTSGIYAQSGVQTLTSARGSGNVDFSPDGTKIAYICCSDGTNETLAVYDLTDCSITPWATAPFFWDITWFRGGASIAYSTQIPTALYELTGPGAAPQLLYTGQGQLDIDSSRTDPEALLLSYNDTSGDARIGLWKNGAFTDSNLANSARSWVGNLNCRDDKLVYGGVQNNSGSQAFYVRDLNTGTVTLVSKNSNIMPQYWPTCS
jgi:Tol biopolymer transport system component